MTTLNSNDSVKPWAERVSGAAVDTFSSKSGWAGIASGGVVGLAAGVHPVLGLIAAAASQIVGRTLAPSRSPTVGSSNNPQNTL